MLGYAVVAPLLLAAPAAPQSASAQSVRTGLDGAEMDACGSVGKVIGLKATGENFLSVRSGPSTKARSLARLRAGANVHVCDRTPDEKWFGIVWDSSGNGADCGVSSAIARPTRYAGPCASGWVSARFVEIVAG